MIVDNTGNTKYTHQCDFHPTERGSVSAKSIADLLLFSVIAVLRRIFFRLHLKHIRSICEVCLVESMLSSERGVQTRRAVSLWSEDHNDSLIYLSQTRGP